jgi:two-component system C4-dicarboxylate transport response regulator DctD
VSEACSTLNHQKLVTGLVEFLAYKIVYLDDDKDLCSAVSDYLNSLGFLARAVTDSDEAVRIVKEDPPDLLLIDYHLNGTTGLDVAAKMDPNVPKILLTGELSPPDSTLIVKILSKPFRIKQLIEEINEQLKTR